MDLTDLWIASVPHMDMRMPRGYKDLLTHTMFSFLACAFLVSITLPTTVALVTEDNHIFDASTAYSPHNHTDSVVNIANVNKNQIIVAYPSSLQLLNHADITLIEDPMTSVWTWSLPLGTSIVAGPVLHASKQELFIGDDQYRVYSISVATGQLNWMKSMDPKIRHPNNLMTIASHSNGRTVVASAGEQLMAFSVDLGNLLYHRRVGPSVIRTPLIFVSPANNRGSTFSSKIIFGDSSGVVHAIDVASGKKSWSWKFETSSTSIVDIVLDKAGNNGVDVIVVANAVGDLASLRGDTGTLLWRSHIMQHSGSASNMNEEMQMIAASGTLLDQETCLFVSNDRAHGALVHAVNIKTGTARVWTLLSGPGSLVNGLKIDSTIPYVL